MKILVQEITGKYRPSWAAARKILKDLDYMVVTCVDGLTGITRGLEVYCSALMMGEVEKKIKEVLPDFEVYGLPNNEKVIVE